MSDVVMIILHRFLLVSCLVIHYRFCIMSFLILYHVFPSSVRPSLPTGLLHRVLVHIIIYHLSLILDHGPSSPQMTNEPGRESSFLAFLPFQPSAVTWLCRTFHASLMAQSYRPSARTRRGGTWLRHISGLPIAYWRGPVLPTSSMCSLQPYSA